MEWVTTGEVFDIVPIIVVEIIDTDDTVVDFLLDRGPKVSWKLDPLVVDLLLVTADDPAVNVVLMKDCVRRGIGVNAAFVGVHILIFL